MKKLLYTLAIVWLLLGFVVGASYYPEIIAELEDIRKPAPKPPPGINFIVRLVIDGGTICSGVVIDDTTIVTAAHCVLVSTPFGAFVTPEPIEIRGPDNKPLQVYGKPHRVSPVLDRASLKGDFRKFRKAKVIEKIEDSNNIRRPGTRFIICGYPMGRNLFCSRGVYVNEDNFFMRIRGLLIPGMSGGPTMLEDGTVVATNTAVEGPYSIVAPLFDMEDWK